MEDGEENFHVDIGGLILVVKGLMITFGEHSPSEQYKRGLNFNMSNCECVNSFCNCLQQRKHAS